MRALVATVLDPFRPADSRQVRLVRRRRRIRSLAPATSRPYIAILNGQPILRAGWRRRLCDGDNLAFVVLPQGGDGGSNPLQIVLGIVVSIFAPQIGALIYEEMVGAAAVTSMGSMIAQAAAGLVGAALVNAAFPPPRPATPHQAAALASPSPTYALNAQGNMARLDAAIPVQYGRMMAYPDFAAQPYVEYAGNEQYLYQLLCLGAGEYAVEAIRIEDTPVANFAEIDYEVVAPGGTVTMFPTNVITAPELSGQELTNAGYIGPFVASAAATAANALAFDFVLPRGLYHVNTTTGALEDVSLTVQMEAREIDDLGVPVGAGTWTVLGTRTWTAKTTTPQRYSERVGVAPARYECRCTRIDVKQTDSSYGHEVIWSGLRAYLPETRQFGDVTLIALRMRASNNLSAQASRKINVISTRKLSVWSGSAWSAPTPTASIAWAVADACRNADYGAGLADSRIDLAGLLALDAVWAARGDEFNGRFDSAMSFWEGLTKIAEAGRAKPYMQGGVVRVARDQAASLPVALFSMRNIVRGSFGLDYILPTDESADAVEVKYFDRNTWAWQRVQAKLAGSTAVKPAKVELMGVTDRAQAYREGMYLAASNRYRRRLVKFATEMEGFIPSYGDLIAIQHDMPAWGQHAEAVAWDAVTRTLTLSEPPTWGTGSHYIGLRTRAGALDGPYQVTAGAAANQVVLLDAPVTTPYTGLDEERTHVVFGWGETWRQLARVVAVRPRGLYQVEIEAVNEDSNVHTADQGVTTPTAPTSQLTTLYTVPQIAGLTLRASPADATKALLTWSPAPGAASYQIEMAAGVDLYDANLTWTRVGETSASNFAVTAVYGAQTIIRVRAVGLAVGPWVSLFYGSTADYMWINDAAPMWAVDDSTLMWRY